MIVVKVVSWIKLEAVGDYDGFSNHSSASGKGWSWGAYSNHSGTRYLSWTFPGVIAYESTIALTTGSWKHYAISFNDTTNTIYYYANGVEEAEASSVTQSIGADTDSYYLCGKNAGYDLDGDLDEHSVFSSILDSTDINDIMDNGLVQAGVPGITLHNVTIY